MPVASTWVVSETSQFAFGGVSGAKEHLVGWLAPVRPLKAPGLGVLQDIAAAAGSTELANSGNCVIAEGDSATVLLHPTGGRLVVFISRCTDVVNGEGGSGPGFLLALQRHGAGVAVNVADVEALVQGPGIEAVGTVNPVIVCLVPTLPLAVTVSYSGRPDTLKTFLRNFADRVLAQTSGPGAWGLRPTLLVSVPDLEVPTAEGIVAGAGLPADGVRVIGIESSLPPGTLPVGSPFSLAAARHAGALSVPSDSTLVFLDVDMAVDAAALTRMALLTHPGAGMAFPVCWSTYRGHADDPVGLSSGYWRMAAFGNMAVAKSDYTTMPNFGRSATHAQWGREDSKFASAALAREGFAVARWVEPGLAHRWHPKDCSGVTDAETRQTCENVAAMNADSHLALAARVAELEGKLAGQGGG